MRLRVWSTSIREGESFELPETTLLVPDGRPYHMQIIPCGSTDNPWWEVRVIVHE